MNSQSELQFVLAGGARYEIGSHIATWQRRSNDEKIIDLSFRGKHFEITQEGTGSVGRPRFLVNGIRTPEGKLFQGRGLLELLRKLDDNWDSFVEIPARLERIERRIDTLIGRRPPAKTKLCLVMMTATWHQERYIPKAALGGFARVPIQIIAASQCMAAGEYRVLQAVLFCAQGTGLLAAGKYRLAKLANVDPSDVKTYLLFLSNRRILRPTGEILKHGIKEYEVLTHPWLCEDQSGEICAVTGGTVPPVEAEVDGGKNVRGRGEKCAERGESVPPNKNTSKNCLKSTRPSTRVRVGESDQQTPPKLDKATRSFCEKELLVCLTRIMGPGEMLKNAPMWRLRIRSYYLAVIKPIREYYGLSQSERDKIQNPAAWMTDRYFACGGRSIKK